MAMLPQPPTKPITGGMIWVILFWMSISSLLMLHFLPLFVKVLPFLVSFELTTGGFDAHSLQHFNYHALCHGRLFFVFWFLGSFLNSFTCSTAKSKTPPHETFSPPLNGTEHGSQPSLTTRDRELVSLLEVRIELGDLNPRPLTPQQSSIVICILYYNLFWIFLILNITVCNLIILCITRVQT